MTQNTSLDLSKNVTSACELLERFWCLYMASKTYSTIDDEAARLGVARRTIAKWIKTRRIPSYRLGRVRRLVAEEVDIALSRYRYSETH